MADYAGAVAAIRARLEANWATTPIAWPNEAEPDKQDLDGNASAWVYAEVVGVGAVWRGVGSPGERVNVYDGLILLHVFVPKGTGTATAHAYAVQLGEIFRSAEFYTDEPGHAVRTMAPRHDGGGDGDEDGNWYRVTTTIDFEYWHRG